MKSRMTTALIVMLMAGWLGGCGAEHREERDQSDLRVGAQGR
jgi:hypothetical protein